MTEDDTRLAAELAGRAGELLMKLRAQSGLEGQLLGKEGDRQANRLIVDELRDRRTDDGLLSEESTDDCGRLSKRRVWVVDPLDGTREYSEGRDDFAVHIALAMDGQARCGAVALPALGQIFRSDQTTGLPAPREHPRILVSRTRPPREAAALAKALEGELVPMGGAGAKAMAVVRGEAEIYVHSGGQYEWDNCAPVAVSAAHGLHCSRIDGAPLVYNQPDPYVPDLLICRKRWAARVLTTLRSLT